MKKFLIVSIVTSLFFVVHCRAMVVLPSDTIFTKVINAKKYIVHSVAKGDIWFSLAREYGISYGELRSMNPDVGDNLSPGQEILILWERTKFNFERNLKDYRRLDYPSYYTVHAGETLFSIAKKNDISVDSLKAWNSLTSNTVKDNQELVVGYTQYYVLKKNNEEPVITDETFTPPVENKREEPKPVVSNVPKKQEVKAPELKEEEPSIAEVEPKPVVKKEEKEVVPAAQPEKKTEFPAALPSAISSPKNTERTLPAKTSAPTKNRPVLTPPSNEEAKPEAKSTEEVNTPPPVSPVVPAKYNKKPNTQLTPKIISEKGTASWDVTDNLNPDKYFALHATAPIGTIIKVINPANNKYVYVKVAGALPESEDKDIIVITKTSADKLDIHNAHFSCNIVYTIYQ